MKQRTKDNYIHIYVPSVTLFIIGIFGSGIVPLGIIGTVEVVSLRHGGERIEGVRKCERLHGVYMSN